MDDIIDMKSKDLTIIIGKFNSSKTTKILEILNNLIEQNISTLFLLFGGRRK